MLDLQAIKDRLGAAASGCWCWSPELKARSIDGYDEFLIVSYDRKSNDPELVATARTECFASLIACAPQDLGLLVAEVEALRRAIQSHRATTEQRLGGASPWVTDVELWTVLDA